MKFMIAICALLCGVLLSTSSVLGAGATSSVGVTINGAAVGFTTDSGRPFVDGANRTQVPLRLTMESCGLTVGWDQARQTASVSDGTNLVEVPIGQAYILKNGERIQNDTAAVVIDGRTYLPIRVVLEAFGAEVGWDQAASMVLVTYSSKEPSQSEKPMKDPAEADKNYLDGKSFPIFLDKALANADFGMPAEFNESNVEAGVIGTVSEDFDLDGEKETLEFVISDSAANSKCVTGIMYEEVDGALAVSDTVLLEEGIFQIDESELDLFLFEKDGRTYIGNQCYAFSSHFADGLLWNLDTYYYDGTKFVADQQWRLAGSAIMDEELAPIIAEIRAYGLNVTEIWSEKMVTEQLDSLRLISKVTVEWSEAVPFDLFMDWLADGNSMTLEVSKVSFDDRTR